LFDALIREATAVYGLEAINAHNGWAMAFAGALIVMVGLTVLALVISQLYKLAALFENRGRKPHRVDSIEEKTAPRNRFFCELDDAQEIYRPLVEELDECFELKELYEMARQQDLPHIHLTIRSLRECGILVPTGEGLFSWKG
jgi:hypothetical protein